VGPWDCDFVGPWVYGSVRLWVYGSMCLWVRGSLGSGSVGLWVCGSVSLGRLCQSVHKHNFSKIRTGYFQYNLVSFFFFLSSPVEFVHSVSSPVI
jgi:hypothetical protein